MLSITQKELLERCVQRDIKAQKEFYGLFARKMMGVCIRYAAGVDEAKDFMQEGFLQVFDKIGTFNSTGSLEGWVRKVMINTCLMELRKTKQLFSDVEEIQIGEDQVYTYMNEQDILKFIQRLPKGFRMIFNLYAVEGYSHKEIAEKLQISEGTSKSQYARSRKALQDMIKGEQKAIA